MNALDDKKETAAGPRHEVHFVGAGPGDPELITVKGQRLLQEADRLGISDRILIPEEGVGIEW